MARKPCQSCQKRIYVGIGHTCSVETCAYFTPTNPMTTDKRDGGELLPLPELPKQVEGYAGDYWTPDQVEEYAISYARANVERALAESREALAALKASMTGDAENHVAIERDHHKARAERLAGALRKWWLSKRPASWNEASHRAYHRVNCTTKAEEALADAALTDQETT